MWVAEGLRGGKMAARLKKRELCFDANFKNLQRFSLTILERYSPFIVIPTKAPLYRRNPNFQISPPNPFVADALLV